jgi:hypothetical protein
MRRMRILLALGVPLAMGISAVAALSVPRTDAPEVTGDGTLVQARSRCPKGQYFCPGKVNGCCPNGWGCGSTSCIRPKPRYGNCHWDGTGPFCAGSCRYPKVEVRRRSGGCVTGSRAYCCEEMRSISTP